MQSASLQLAAAEAKPPPPAPSSKLICFALLCQDKTASKMFTSYFTGTETKPKTTGTAVDDRILPEVEMVTALAVPRSKTTRYSQRCFAVSNTLEFTSFSLPLSVRDPSLTLTQFCARLKTVLFCRAYSAEQTLA